MNLLPSMSVTITPVIAVVIMNAVGHRFTQTFRVPFCQMYFRNKGSTYHKEFVFKIHYGLPR